MSLLSAAWPYFPKELLGGTPGASGISSVGAPVPGCVLSNQAVKCSEIPPDNMCAVKVICSFICPVV